MSASADASSNAASTLDVTHFPEAAWAGVKRVVENIPTMGCNLWAAQQVRTIELWGN